MRSRLDTFPALNNNSDQWEAALTLPALKYTFCKINQEEMIFQKFAFYCVLYYH